MTTHAIAAGDALAFERATHGVQELRRRGHEAVLGPDLLLDRLVVGSADQLCGGIGRAGAGGDPAPRTSQGWTVTRPV
jgi:hypothetical protein